jgi:acetylornithine aminotransferase
VLDTLEKENAVENAATVGAYIVDQLRAQLVDNNVQVRGFGMMIGIQLPKDCAELVAIARDEYQLIVNVTAGSVVRLLPPLNMTQVQADELLKRLVPAIQNFLKA